MGHFEFRVSANPRQFTLFSVARHTFVRVLSLGLALILDNLRCLVSQGKWNEFRVSANPRQFTLFSVARHTLVRVFEFRVSANPRQFLAPIHAQADGK